MALTQSSREGNRSSPVNNHGPLVVFFDIVAVIHDQHLFSPVICYVLSLTGHMQLAAYYIANGLLASISDNVFVATVYISETKMHIAELLGHIPDIGMSGADLMGKLTAAHTPRAEVFAVLPQGAAEQAKVIMDQFDKLAVAINTGTNIPSVATPNRQAAFPMREDSAERSGLYRIYNRLLLVKLSPKAFTRWSKAGNLPLPGVTPHMHTEKPARRFYANRSIGFNH